MAAKAYAILCHANHLWVEQQFARLWSPENVYFYHVDLKAPEALHRLAASLTASYDNVFTVPSLLCSWAGFSLVEAMLDLANAAVRKGGVWTHLIFLSEQHLPLVSHADVSAALEPGISYLTCKPFLSLEGAPRLDVLHRFCGAYFEVPGVGGFRVTNGLHDESFFSALHHSGQWMVLAHEACLALSADRDSAFWEPFRMSLLADETAIPTWLAQCPAPSARNFTVRDCTFVAAPIDGGNPDMTFGESTYFQALSRGFLFIRKRPEVLPSAVVNHLNTVFPAAATIKIAKLNTAARVSVVPSFHLIDAFFVLANIALSRTSPAIVIARLSPDVTGPAFFGLVQSPMLSGAIDIFVLSGDLVCFKVAAISTQPSCDLETQWLNGCETTLLKVRGGYVGDHREYHVGADLNAGIVTLSSCDDMIRLAAMIEAFVDRVSRYERSSAATG